MQFKYQDYLDQITNCPNDTFVAKDLVAFRIMVKNCIDESNWLPRALLPNRRATPGNKNKSCQEYSLSFFTELEKLLEFQKKMAKSYTKWREYNFAAEVQIDKTCGLCGNIDGKGHFDIHEFAKVDLRDNISKCIEI